jgi:hypothetical protein
MSAGNPYEAPKTPVFDLEPSSKIANAAVVLLLLPASNRWFSAKK